jgi:hypothetical protein
MLVVRGVSLETFGVFSCMHHHHQIMNLSAF